MKWIQKCPCCGEKFGFWSYYIQSNMKNIQTQECSQCQQTILLSISKKDNRSNFDSYVIVFISYLLFNHTFRIIWGIELFLLHIFTHYLAYIQEKFRCHDASEVQKYQKSNEGSRILFISLILLCLFLQFRVMFIGG